MRVNDDDRGTWGSSRQDLETGNNTGQRPKPLPWSSHRQLPLEAPGAALSIVLGASPSGQRRRGGRAPGAPSPGKVRGPFKSRRQGRKGGLHQPPRGSRAALLPCTCRGGKLQRADPALRPREAPAGFARLGAQAPRRAAVPGPRSGSRHGSASRPPGGLLAGPPEPHSSGMAALTDAPPEGDTTSHRRPPLPRQRRMPAHFARPSRCGPPAAAHKPAPPSPASSDPEPQAPYLRHAERGGPWPPPAEARVCRARAWRARCQGCSAP